MSTVTRQHLTVARRADKPAVHGVTRRTMSAPAPGPFAIEMMELGTPANPTHVRVGRKRGNGKGVPLLLEKPGSRAHRPLCAAPGEYVLQT